MDKNSEQREYILEKISKQSPKHSKISTPVAKYILENCFGCGSKMIKSHRKINSLLSSSQKSKFLYQLSNKHIKNIREITTHSSQSCVYSLIINEDNTDICVVIKIPKNDDMSILTEYYIGMFGINNLRQYIPNYLYTFGAYLCPDNERINNIIIPKDIPIVMYENIEGYTIEYLLKRRYLTFEKYLGIFLQILLALEFGQKLISFCHHDLHTENVMTRNLKQPYQYTIPLYNKIYRVTATEYLPVIIDYGYSTIKNSDKYIGSYKFTQYGMVHYILQGVDMYKFLVYSIKYARENLQREIFGLMDFYGVEDPYKILVKGTEKAIKEHTKKIAFSSTASYTPMMFFNWIINHPQYSTIANKYVNFSDRNILVTLQEPLECSDIDFVKNIHPGYLTNMYIIKILEKLGEDTKIRKQIMDKNKQKMLDFDMIILDKFSNKYVDTEKILFLSENILKKTIKIRSKTRIEKLILSFLQEISFYDDLQKYLQQLYIIRELGFENLYKDFIDRIESSEQYLFYNQYSVLIERVRRWGQSLLETVSI